MLEDHLPAACGRGHLGGPATLLLGGSNANHDSEHIEIDFVIYLFIKTYRQSLDFRAEQP